jgi:uncharacterized membrane protein
MKRTVMVAIWSGALAVAELASAQGAKPAQYSVTDLGTLGGAYSSSYTINNAGAIAGGAAIPGQVDGISQTAFIWYHGSIASLGTLGGADCPMCNSENAAVSMSGTSVVLSETATADPNGEDFCGFGTHRQCLAGVWINGGLQALPTLTGGHNSQAYSVNKQGAAVGFSETGVADANCAMPHQIFQYEAVIWGTNGVPMPLRPLRGDTVSFALGVNDAGQSVGVSGLCSNVTFPPNATPGGPHAVIWDAYGVPTAIDSLPGAVGNNVAGSINDLGDVVGTQLLSDGTVHSFLWNKTTGLRDLMMPGTFLTVAPCCRSINESRQITGFAINDNGPLGFVWQNGTFTDLNTVLAAGSPWYIFNSAAINSVGQIAATGFNFVTGEVHAVLLSPLPAKGAPLARGAVPMPALPAAILSKYQGRK